MKLKKMMLASVAGSFISATAFAGMLDGYNADWSTGWYLGAGVAGNSQTTMDLRGGFDQFGSAANGKIEQSDNAIGFDVYVGRQISNYWRAELGFTWLDETKFKVKNVNSGETVQTIKVEDQWNIHLVGVGVLPLGDYFNAFAKLGAAYWETDQRYHTLATGGKFTDTANAFALTYGVGLELNWEQFGVRAEYNVIQPAENVRDDFYVSDIVSANVFYKFM